MKNTQADKNQVSKSRRSFLRKTAVVSGGVAGAAGLSGQVLAETEAPAPATDTDEGYRMTAHIAEYYKTAKL